MQWALPQKALSAPLYAYYGGKDPFIDVAWVTAAVERRARWVASLTIVYAPHGGHNPAGAVELVKWMADRSRVGRRHDC